MKNYGAKGQIGHGQASQEEYLQDLSGILQELLRVGRAGSALWIVLDTVKSSGETLLLPWEIIQRARNVGWTFSDTIIWDKGRSLPWSHVGLFRGVFEYILLFSKGAIERFALDKIRETDQLSSYWVKYPERYNPNGKAPSDLWHFPIPVQGSWSRNGLRHFCPFPSSMVARMIALTTKEGDIVLDPFAGTGTVPVVASFMKRRGLGMEVNRAYFRTFATQGHDSLLGILRSENKNAKKATSQGSLKGLIVHLRMLKYPKSLFAEVLRPDRLGKSARDAISGFLVVGTASSSPNGTQRAELGEIAVYVIASKGADVRSLRAAVNSARRRPPLSKFGLDASLKVISSRTWRSKTFVRALGAKRWFLYSKGVFHSYAGAVSKRDLLRLFQESTDGSQHRVPPIVSPIRVDIPLMIVG